MYSESMMGSIKRTGYWHAYIINGYFDTQNDPFGGFMMVFKRFFDPVHTQHIKLLVSR